MQGKIIKGIAGFYYVHVVESGVYECKAKGIFRKRNVKPLVGDNVEIEILDAQEMKGNILEILPRKNALIRPAVANVDQALVIFAVTHPEPNLNLLDRFLVEMNRQDVDTVICFNKKDLAGAKQCEKLSRIYEKSGCRVLFVSALTEEGKQDIMNILHGKVTTVAGPSGVGKSSLINTLQSDVSMETGDISEKIQRGKHTTRHSQFIHVEGNTYILDTPGFSSMYVENLEAEDLKEFYPEFVAYEQYCRFQGCNHVNEPDCGIKQAVEEGMIDESRYSNYTLIYRELKNKKKY